MPMLLLIEDTESLASTIIEELNKVSFQVSHASDGHTAIKLFKETGFDLVILDWMLPDMDGLELLRQLRQHKATPVLMLTARSDEIDRVIGLEAGADDYLTKPFHVRELIARIRSMLRRVDLIIQMIEQDRDKPSSHILQHSDIWLDENAMQVEVAGTPIDLSPTEFALLRLFMLSPGRAFSRSYLMDVIWESQYEKTDRAVDYMIMRLRKKLGAAGDKIETVWGTGYRLNAYE